MGGKTSTSTQSVSIPPEVLARYNAVNARAEDVAKRPFQQYGTDASAFVAPLTQSQTAGISATNAAAGAAKPYYDTATGLLNRGYGQGQSYYDVAGRSLTGSQNVANTLQQTAINDVGQAQQAGQPYLGAATEMTAQGSGPTNVGQLSAQDINRYMNPFVESVVNPTSRLLRQKQQQEMSGQTGNAIRSGAFGGDRAGIAAATLAGQQDLAYAGAINPLYSQAYQQGVGTAQQQQGFGLQQQQANLARRLQAGQQMLGIGQQGYAQGMGAAQQRAALANQIFGQGATAAQQQAALGQGLYSMGQGASQGYAGLGTGAQTAALQGAAAQMQAGQQQQQTEQAGKQALYNQFLQQQGYPFQVAQFLANIAMGTGALSGSTTTTTQPTSFFSDRRLKHDIHRIGETDDGMPIYKFKYKGDPAEQTHIGLMAQDVEKTKPEAVGLAAGYKTVDYDRATRASGGLVPSSMGGMVYEDHAGEGFADGGMPQLDIFGGGPSRIPASVLAQMQNSPRRPLMTPSMGLKPQSGGFADMMGEAQKALGAGETLKKLYEGGKDAYKWLNKAGGGSVDPYDPDEKRPDFMTSVLREGKVDTNSLPKPGQLPQQKSGLSELASGVGAIKGLYDVGSGIGSFLLPLLALKNGGVVPRHGYALDGAVDEADLPAVGAQEAGGRLADMSPEDIAIRTIAAESSGDPEESRAIAHVLRNRVKSGRWGSDIPSVVLAKGQFEPWANPEGKNYPLKIDPNSARYRTALAAFRNAGEDPTGGATHFYAPAAQKALGREPPSWGKVGGLDIGATRFFKDVDGGGPAKGGVTPEGITADSIANKYLSAPGVNTTTGGVKGLLTSEKFWVPLLTGLGTMAASPSRYLGSAILQGLGGGAQAYANLEKQQMEQQSELAKIGQTKAATGQTEAQTEGVQIENFMRSFKDTPYGRVVFLATGVPILASEYQRRWLAGERIPLLGKVPPDAEARAAAVFGKSQPGSTMGGIKPVISLPPPPPPTASTDTGAGAADAKEAPVKETSVQPVPEKREPAPFTAPKPLPVPSGVNYDKKSRELAQSEQDIGLDAGPAFELAKKQTDDYNKLVTTDVSAARQNSPYLNQLATTLSNAYKGGGFDTPGYAADVRAEVIRAANTFLKALGGSDISDLDKDADVINKISTLLGSQGAAAGNQESFAALNAIRNAIPNLRMNPDAGAKLTAELMQMKQRAIDRDAHAALYSSDSGGLMKNAARDFRDKNPDGKYQMESSIIEDLIKHRPDQLKKMMSGTIKPEHIDEAIRKWYGNGAPSGMHRYFAPRGP